MGVHYFSDDQVSNKAITYSEVFKQHFINDLDQGKFPTQIFREADFDTKVVGKQRIDNFSRRVRKMASRVEKFTDLRAHHSGRPQTKKRTEIAYLKYQVAM